jgi:hypothetical protein
VNATTRTRARAVGGVVVAALTATMLVTVGAFSASAATRHRRRAAPVSQFAEPGFAPPPAPVAPFAVGVLDVTYTDTTRGTAARGSAPASSTRPISVTVRYPAEGDPSTPPAQDAPALDDAFPLVVFAHGFDVSADTYATLETQLAAAGFVVAAPE